MPSEARAVKAQTVAIRVADRDPDGLMTVAELALLMGLDPKTVRRIVRDHNPVFLGPKRQLRWRVASYLRYTSEGGDGECGSDHHSRSESGSGGRSFSSGVTTGLASGSKRPRGKQTANSRSKLQNASNENESSNPYLKPIKPRKPRGPQRSFTH